MRTQRTASPVAVALDQLGVDLTRGESFTTGEARQLVGLVRATLDVFETAAPAEQHAPGTAPLLETAQYAMRDLQHALNEVLTEHRQFTTTLAPILRELLLAVQPEAAPRTWAMPLPARALLDDMRPPADTDRASAGSERSPTLATLVRSLAESIASLQAVLPRDAVARAEALAAPEHPAGPIGGDHNGQAAGAEHTSAEDSGAAAPAGHTGAATSGVPTLATASTARASALTALPAATIRLLQTLAGALADVQTLLPLQARSLSEAIPTVAQPASAPNSAPGSPPDAVGLQPSQRLARALGEAIVLLGEGLPAPAGPVTGQDHSGQPRTTPPASLQPAPPTSEVRLGSAVALTISLSHELLVPAAPHLETLPPPRPDEASRSPAATPVEVAKLAPPDSTNVSPTLAPGLTQLAPLLAASLAEVIANLRSGLPSALLERAEDSAPLVTAVLLAELETFATSLAPVPAQLLLPAAAAELVDAYRWGLLVGLHYRPAPGRPIQTRNSASRPRCETCGRLLEQTRSGTLVCPTC